VPFKNTVIRLSAFDRQTIDGKPCIVLDNNQDSANHLHSLALVPAVKEEKKISFPNHEIQFLKNKVAGLFQIKFDMSLKYGYLVLGIVPQNVIADITFNNHFADTASTPQNVPGEVCKHDQKMVRSWIDDHSAWVQSNGMVINA